MASNYGIVDQEIKDQYHHHHDHHHDQHHHHHVTSPRSFRRSTSSSPTSSGGGGQGAASKCVCAPATHAGSFKCRLHRTNSQGSHSPPAVAAADATAPSPPTPPVSSPSSRTVEAQEVCGREPIDQRGIMNL